MKRLALGIATVVVLTLLPAGVGAVAVEPVTARARAVTLSAPATTHAGSRIVLTGRVLKAPRGTKVKLQRWTGRAWQTRGIVRTGAGGRFSAAIVVPGPGRSAYRAAVTQRRKVRASATRYVAVLRRHTVQVRSARTNVERGAPFTLNVSATPAQAGGPVVLQTRTGSGAWTNVGTSTLGTAGTGTFRPSPATTGTVQYRVVKPRYRYDDAATSAAVAVTAQPKDVTFGELMDPASAEVVDPSVATWSFHAQQPAWWSRNAQIRWDTPGAFTSSLTPQPDGAHRGANPPSSYDPSEGAEFNNGNSSLQTADVSFSATGSTFAIRFRTYHSGTAMVWLDGHPISATPIAGVAPTGNGQLNWIQITMPQPRTVHVRFAGPAHFVGVDHDADVPLTVRAAPYPFTLGVVSDSYYDGSLPYRTYEGSGAAVLHTLTGFRIWCLAQGGTGYLSDAAGGGFPGHYASAFGSAARMARLKDAPIDALLVNGSINDAWYDNAAYAAAVDRFLDDVARIRPGLPVVVVGLEPVTVVPGATAWDADLAAKNDLLEQIASEHANVVGFINAYDEDWLTGTGSTTQPQGDGNQDQYVADDHIHLSPAGQAYYQGLVAERLRQLPATLGEG